MIYILVFCKHYSNLKYSQNNSIKIQLFKILAYLNFYIIFKIKNKTIEKLNLQYISHQKIISQRYLNHY